jgi:putative ATP-binding cassette transporter
MQPGSLRSQLAYPHTRTELGDDQLLAILREAHLPELAQRVGGLDTEHDWDKLLSTGEQQRLAFARVLVHRPRIVMLDEATSALDARSEAALYKQLRDEGMTLVSVAHRASVLRYHQQVLELDGEGGWALHPAEGYRFED